MSSTRSKSQIVFRENNPDVIIVSERKLTIVECPEIVITQRRCDPKNRRYVKKSKNIINKK